ncbi:MAG: cysteine hydrolase [Chloroflexi bacterium]|nr:cysteine hydrolase [Chloroflexota bacterium]
MELGSFTEDQVLALARDAYEHGNANFDILPEKCALLVIDMQDEFVKPGWCPFWVPEATRQVPRIKALLDCARSKQIPVIYTTFAATHHYLDRPASGAAMSNRYPQLDIDDSTLFRDGTVWHELAPLDSDIVIHKPSYGAFYDTPLETILRNLGKDTVIISGTLTNFCCGTTARQAYERSFKVVFGSDVTATDDSSLQEAELKVLRKGFARVLTAAEIMQALG